MDVRMSPTAERSDEILVLWGMSINTDPFSSTVFLFCSPLEIHIPLFLHLQMPWVVMEHSTRDLLCLFSDLLGKQKVPTCDRHLSVPQELAVDRQKQREMPLGYSPHAQWGKHWGKSSWHPFWRQISKLNEKAQMSWKCYVFVHFWAKTMSIWTHLFEHVCLLLASVLRPPGSAATYPSMGWL